jgi:hypothetical protein
MSPEKEDFQVFVNYVRTEKTQPEILTSQLDASSKQDSRWDSKDA